MDKKYVLVLVAVMMIFSITSVYAWTSNNFTNGLNEENISLASQTSSDVTVTRYIRFPKGALSVNTTINLTGYNERNFNFVSSTYVEGYTSSPNGNFFMHNDTTYYFTYNSGANRYISGVGITQRHLPYITSFKGIWSNRTHYWIADYNSTAPASFKVFLLNSSLDLNTTYTVTTGCTSLANCNGLYGNGTNFFMYDTIFKTLVTYNRTFGVVSTLNVDVPYIDNFFNPFSIFNNGTNFWFSDGSTNVIRETDKNFNLIGDKINSVDANGINMNIAKTVNGKEFYRAFDIGGFAYLVKYNITSLSNLNVSVNNQGAYYYSGSFIQENNKTNDLSPYINNYLSTCTYVNGYCDVPINFQSKTAGKFEYDDLSVLGEGGIELGTVNYLRNTTENTKTTFTINITYDSNYYDVMYPYIIYNNTQYLADIVGTGDNVNLSVDITSPLVTSDTNVSFYWNISGQKGAIITTLNTTIYNQTVYNLAFDNCSTYTNRIYNFTIYDEGGLNLLNGTSNNTLFNVELYLSPVGTSNGLTLFYNKQYVQINPAYICSNINFTNNTYRVDIIADYQSTGRVKEFYYLDNGTFLNTQNKISLYDLATVDSTSFLFKFYDIDGLQLDDIIVHTFRKYIGDGLFREVERSKQNDDGQTIVHLVEEDIIYYFQITQNNQTIYTSNTYTALCQAVPCSIELEASGGSITFSDDWDLIDNGGYSLTKNKTSRTVSLSFSLTSPSEMNLTLYKLNGDGSYSAITSEAITSTSSTITLTVPIVSGNTTFFATVYQDDVFKRSAWVDFGDDASIYFGTATALFLAGIVLLTLGLIAITEGGTITVIFIILGLFVVSILGLVNFGGTAINVLLYLAIAGAILIWKVSKRRRGG